MSNQFQFPSGSEWRKWDLQVQPIKSEWFLDLKNKESKIKSATKQYIEHAINNDISVIAITDHNCGFAIDIACKIVEKDKFSIKILPGVEIDTTEGFQLLIIFNPAYKEDIQKQSWKETIDHFLNNKCSLSSPVFDENGAAKPIKINTDELLQNICKESIGIPIFAHAQSEKGLFQKTSARIRKNFFEENKSGKYYFALDHKEDKDIQETKKNLTGWGYKADEFPLIKTSDAHKASEVGRYFTWIKADPSFEGLKQIIYEPKERVRLEESKPEEKGAYQIIEKVKFCDSAFPSKEIFLNQNLTAIIGGKSTGKSLLLRNIARCIASKEVDDRLSEVNLNDYQKEISNFIVTWKDGKKYESKDKGEVEKKIIYIPQSYLNRLLDKEEDETSIDDIIKNVLEQEDNILRAFEGLGKANRETQREIAIGIENILSTEENFKNLEERIKEIGDRKGIENEIEKMEKNISSLMEKHKLSVEETKKYKDLSQKISQAEESLDTEKSYMQTLDALKEESLTFNLDFSEYSLPSSKEKFLWKELKKIESKAKESFLKKIEAECEKAKKEIGDITAELKSLKNKFSPLQDKVKKEKDFQEKNKKLQAEKKKLSDILKKETQIRKLKSKYDEGIHRLLKRYSDFYSKYSKFQAIIQEQKVIPKNQNLKFEITTIFKERLFDERVDEVSDKRKLSKFKEELEENYNKAEDINRNKYVGIYVHAILDETLALKISKKEALIKLLQDGYIFKYTLKEGRDDISNMSPGKKAFLLLKLLIEFDNSKCPILIDQPEDDLDNRSIYNELVTFIKAKKAERQIIIVTHDPNLVVGSDCECVIVAHQYGDRPTKQINIFDYVQGSLENTFLNEEEENILYKRRIQEHVCDILEGGKLAFEKRRKKYNFN